MSGEGAGPARLAWFHCYAGIAGDMALGALLDAGADVDAVRELLRRLPVDGWELDADAAMRNGIGATKARVRATGGGVVRTAAHITALVEEARLPDRVRRRALATFQALAVAEGRLHRRPPESVHFHEVGGIDAIVDIVGTCAALEVLDIDEVWTSPVANGIGMVRAAHGLLPVPAPAVVALLADVPTYGIDVPFELTTPTGAALVAALATGHGPLPPMTIDVSGFGAGDHDLGARSNTVQVVIGERADALDRGEPVVQLEVNVDDATGEALAHALAEVLAAGAHDAWIAPVVMKKGRPAHVVHALCDVALAGQVARVLTEETGSLGVRGTTLERWPLPRTAQVVDVGGFPVRVKVGPGRVKAEHDDAVRVARQLGWTRREVAVAAEDAWRRTGSPTDTPAGPGETAGADVLTFGPVDHGHDHPHDHDHHHEHDHDHE